MTNPENKRRRAATHVAALLFSLAILCSCSLTGMMIPAQTRKVPDSEHAVISFIKGPEKRPITLWAEDRFLGVLPEGGILQCKLRPGKHIFVAVHKKNHTLLVADVEAGGHYALLMGISPLLGTEFSPLVAKTKKSSRLAVWFERNQLLELAPGKEDNYSNSELELVKKYINRFKTGKRVHLRLLAKEMRIDLPPESVTNQGSADAPQQE